jgi:hypothetical protein
MQSDTIGALAAALSKAQGAITGALKDSSNPFFKSKYADLASCGTPAEPNCRRTNSPSSKRSILSATSLC